MGNGIEYDPTKSYEVRTYDVEFRRDPDGPGMATVYQPQGAGPFPAILDIHGGVWNSGSRTNNESIDRRLAASGLVVVAIELRRAPEHTYPAQVVDVNYATRWVKAHAGDLNAYPQSVGGLASSSGGQSAMLSAMRPHDPRYAAIPLPEAGDADATLLYLLCAWPVLDPYARYLYAQEAGMDHLVKYTEAYFLTQEAMQEGNPQLILERGEKVNLCPALIVQGTADKNIPLYIPERFTAAYRQAGGEIEAEYFQDMPHGFGREPGPETDRAIEMMKTFVARQLAATTAAA